MGVVHACILPPYVASALQGFETRGTTRNEHHRQALTIQHLLVLKGRLSDILPSIWDQRCVWAACTVGFCGGPRSSKYLVTGPGRGALRTDIRLTTGECILRLAIHKNKQHGPDAFVEMPAIGTSTCPVRAMSYYVRHETQQCPRIGKFGWETTP